jgi:hypothetical protein
MHFVGKHKIELRFVSIGLLDYKTIHANNKIMGQFDSHPNFL